MAPKHFEWCAAGHHRAHGQERIEPIAELSRKALGDEIRRKPLSPVSPISVVAHGRIRDDSRIQPGIADIGNPARLPAASAAPRLYQVDPRTVRRMSVEFLP